MTTSIDLLDGDIILYQTAYSADKPVEDGPYEFNTASIASSVEDKDRLGEARAKRIVDTLMRELYEATGSQLYHSYLSPSRSTSYRPEMAISQPYKGNRDGKELPKYFQFIRKYLIEHWEFTQVERIETDDMLGIMQTHYNGLEDVRSTIVTKDKDLKQISGRNFNWVTGDLVNVTKLDGHRLLWKQMLTGDSGDNIIGCGKKTLLVYKSGIKEGETYEKRVGVGPKAADEILDSVKPTQYYARVLMEYISKYGNFEGIRKFHETFNLVYILRYASESALCGFPIEDKHFNPINWAEKLGQGCPVEEEEDDEF